MNPLVLALALSVAAEPASLAVEKVDSPVPGLAELVRSKLPELAACTAFKPYPQFVPEDFDKRNDLISFEFGAHSTPAPGENPHRLDPDPHARSDRMNWPCIEVVVQSWLGDEQLSAMAAVPKEQGPALSVAFHFRPTAAEREAIRAVNEKDFSELCKAFAGVKPPADFLAPLRAAQPRLSVGLAGEVGRFMDALPHVNPNDRVLIFAAAIEDFTSVRGVSRRCHELRAWRLVTDADILDSETPLPSATCAARVKQMRELATKPPPGFIPAELRLTGDRGRPVTEAGCLLDGAAMSPYAPVEAKAREEIERQHRPRPIAYLNIDPSFRAREVVKGALAWSMAFEVRLLLGSEKPIERRVAKTAWPEAVGLVDTGLGKWPINIRAERIISSFEQSEASCKGISGALSAPQGADPELRLAREAAAIAGALERCGCPHPWAEIAWARLALAADYWNQTATWIPFDVVEDPEASVIELPRDAKTQDLVNALRGGPVRIDWR